MAVLKVIRGQEFKVKVDDKIDDDNIFKDEYDQAEQMLDSILMAKCDRKDFYFEHENNVIAFCGGRGDGKTSAMLTFMNVHKNKFAKQIVIDPSLFDDVHNILDIVLAEIFRDFKKIYEDDNQKIESGFKEDLLKKFQTVYKQISLINNQTKILDSEYDYEGDIGKLEKLGESTKLKNNLAELIELYAKMKARLCNDDEKCSVMENKPIIIGVDDLDLCSEYAYKMSEEIRKYLIIPGVIIAMAIRVEQLELCVREKNIQDFSNNLNYIESDKVSLQTEVTNMARRYMEKLIPLERRIYLTKAQDITNLTIQLEEIAEIKNEGSKEDETAGQPLVECVLGLIREKTGIIFRPNANGSSFLIPTNLRGIVNIVALLRDMNTDNMLKNLDLLCSYLINEWQPAIKNSAIDFEEINNTYLFDRNTYVYNVLSKYADEKNESKVNVDESIDLSYVIKWFVDFSRNPYEYYKKENVYKVRALYSFALNRLILEKRDEDFRRFINGFIWKDRFDDVIPGTTVDKRIYKRSRFDISLEKAYDTLSKYLRNYFRDENDKMIYEELDYNPKLGDRASYSQKDFLELWFLLGLFLNTKDDDNNILNGELVHGNSMYNYKCQASIENYIVGLANLDLLLNKIDIDRLTNDRNKFIMILEQIKEMNKDTIRCARIIASNMDIAIGILAYCKNKGDYKKATFDESDRTKKLIELFFNNLTEFLKHSGVDTSKCNFGILLWKENEKLKRKHIDIVDVYASLFQDGISESSEKISKQKQSERNIFQKLLNDKDDKEPSTPKSVPVNIKSKTANNVKKNIDVLANFIQKYYIQRDKKPDNNFLDRIINLYDRVLDVYLESKEEILTEDIIQEYKELASELKDSIEKGNDANEVK